MALGARQDTGGLAVGFGKVAIGGACDRPARFAAGLHDFEKGGKVGRGKCETIPNRCQGAQMCAATSSALAVVSVSARMKFCFTQLSRDRRRAGTSGRTSGSNPVLVASATSTAQIVVAISSARAFPSLA